MTHYEIAFSIIGALGGLVGIVAGLTSIHTWRKVNRKVAMLDDADEAFEVLPAWYTNRMMTDDWLFGLLTSSGQTVVINKILGLSSDGKWLNVQLAGPFYVEHVNELCQNPVLAIAEDRTTASIRVGSISAAYDLMTS